MKINKLSLYGLFFLLVLLMTPWIGPEKIPPASAVDYLHSIYSPEGEIFWHQRLPRVLLALLAGGALSIVGAAFQVLFRNPLVEPFTLGVSGGSALGAFIALSVPSLWITWGPFGSIQLLAMAGAAGSLGLIYSLSRKKHGVSVSTLLLTGVTVSIICAGGILLLTYISSPHLLVAFQRWMMGGIDVVGYRQLASLFPLLLPGLGILFLQAGELNQLAMGEDIAAGHGVSVRSVQRNIFLGGGMATASVVALVGPIAFVGLIIPHAVRRLSGYDQRVVLAGSFLLGGSILAVCDAAARIIIRPAELPVGIITAIIGGPLFIYLLVSRRRF